MESTREVWKRIITFVFITYGISSIFMYLAIRAGSMGAGGGLVALGGMWSPGIAAFLTQLIYKKSLRNFGWGWGKTKYQVWSYCIPFLYVGAVHAIVWIFGFGGFASEPLTSGLGNTLKNIAVTTVFGSFPSEALITSPPVGPAAFISLSSSKAEITFEYRVYPYKPSFSGL